MSVAATRVMWPFAPNWREPYTVTYEFKTDIFTSDDGSEQRRALRSTPRKSISYSALAHRDRLRSFNHLIDTSQQLQVIMPEVTRVAETIMDMQAGALSALVDNVPPWLRPGIEVVLSDRANGYVLAKIDSIADTQITFTVSPGARDAGMFIYPALTGRLDAKVTTTRPSNVTAEITVPFSVEPCSELYDFGTPGPTLGGVEWLQVTHNWSAPLPVDHNWPVASIDFGRGRKSSYLQVNFSTAVRTYDLVVSSAESIVAFFCRMRGRRGGFLVSSLEQDMSPAGNFGGNTLTIVGPDVYTSYLNDPVRAAIEINVAGLGLVASRIAGMTLVAGNTVLALTDPLPSIAASQVLRISWLTFARFATDTLEVSYVSSATAKVKLNIQTLPLSAFEIDGTLRATLNGDLRITQTADYRVVYL